VYVNVFVCVNVCDSISRRKGVCIYLCFHACVCVCMHNYLQMHTHMNTLGNKLIHFVSVFCLVCALHIHMH